MVNSFTARKFQKKSFEKIIKFKMFGTPVK